ncbi:hypothetical protein ACJ72_01360 [Emergomyces africanus]|uniref:Uncharacterized protein n=1 Tax=Emergomyces africanus TaxID=1955775 RepID=A0A1B7P5F4_9EURO|nr:hypothetical protein ACJ72_01360 [Emergomyces africanus]
MQPSPLDRTTLCPVHPSRITKSSTKKPPAPRRRPTPHDELPVAGTSSMGASETTQTPPRRSKRLQTQEAITSETPGETTSTGLLHGVSQSKLKRGKPKTLPSTKPRRVSKQIHPRTTPNPRPGNRK